MQAESLLEWPKPLWEYVKFASEFGAVGAVGFCYAAVRGRDRGDGAEPSFHARALVRAAGVGLVAQIVQAFLFWHDLPEQVQRAHAASSAAFLTSNLAAGSQALLVAAGLLGFALAVGRIRAGWMLAAIGVVLGQLTGIVTGQWSRLVNPVHRLVGALWLGTLFVLV